MSDRQASSGPGSVWTVGDGERYRELWGRFNGSCEVALSPDEFLELRLLRLRLRRLLVERLRAEGVVASQPDVGALGQCEVWPVLVLVGLLGLVGLVCFLVVVFGI